MERFFKPLARKSISAASAGSAGSGSAGTSDPAADRRELPPPAKKPASCSAVGGLATGPAPVFGRRPSAAAAKAVAHSSPRSIITWNCNGLSARLARLPS